MQTREWKEMFLDVQMKGVHVAKKFTIVVFNYSSIHDIGLALHYEIEMIFIL